MPTEVVVATIVKTRLSEAGFRQHMVEQLQDNDRHLRDKLADADGGANVVTAVLNADEFLAYLLGRFPTAVDAPAATAKLHGESLEKSRGESPDAVAAATAMQAAVDTSKMSEAEFMDNMFHQLESGAVEPKVQFPADHWDDDEEIGEDFSRYPFYY